MLLLIEEKLFVQFLINKTDETVTLACVASVSNRVIVRKLEREPKKKWKGEGTACYAGYSDL